MPGKATRKERYAVQMLLCLPQEGREPGRSLEPWGWPHLGAAAPAPSAQGTVPAAGLRSTAVTQVIILISTQLRF